MPDVQKTARALTLKIVTRFAETARTRGVRATTLLLPTRYELGRPSPALDFYARQLPRLGLDTWDVREAFGDRHRKQPYSALWCPEEHYARLSSTWVAEYVAQKIQRSLTFSVN